MYNYNAEEQRKKREEEQRRRQQSSRSGSDFAETFSSVVESFTSTDSGSCDSGSCGGGD